MRRALLLVTSCVAFAACRSGGPVNQPKPVVVADTAALPPIPVYEIATGAETGSPVLSPVRSRDPLAGIRSTKRITVTAQNQDVRTLLLWLAEQAGASLVISPDVNARVTVSFRDVPVVDALRAVMAEVGLSVLVGPMQAPWAPVVFYQLPVNVDVASAEAIAARFGVSLDLARFLVESRTKRTP
jgi:hypothetical protein